MVECLLGHVYGPMSSDSRHRLKPFKSPFASMYIFNLCIVYIFPPDCLKENDLKSRFLHLF